MPKLLQNCTHLHALEKEMATHSSVLAWRITGTGGLPSLGSHRVRHDWSDLAVAAAFSPKFSLNIWKFLVHMLLKPHLENFEHYFASMWDECNCVIVWTFSKWGFNSMWTKNFQMFKLNLGENAAAPAKSLQSCPTLCDPIDGSPPGSTVPGILQARTLEWDSWS